MPFIIVSHPWAVSDSEMPHLRKAWKLEDSSFRAPIGWGGFLSHGDTPIAGWFRMENRIEMDDLGVPPIDISICWMVY